MGFGEVRHQLGKGCPVNPVRVPVAVVSAENLGRLVADDEDDIVKEPDGVPMAQVDRQSFRPLAQQLAHRPADPEGCRSGPEGESAHVIKRPEIGQPGLSLAIDPVSPDSGLDGLVGPLEVVGLDVQGKAVQEDQKLEGDPVDGPEQVFDGGFQERGFGIRVIDPGHLGDQVGQVGGETRSVEPAAGIVMALPDLFEEPFGPPFEDIVDRPVGPDGVGGRFRRGSAGEVDPVESFRVEGFLTPVQGPGPSPQVRFNPAKPALSGGQPVRVHLRRPPAIEDNAGQSQDAGNGGQDPAEGPQGLPSGPGDRGGQNHPSGHAGQGDGRGCSVEDRQPVGGVGHGRRTRR